MAEKTPDQIRRETVPKKYYGLTYGFLGGLLGAVLSFGIWGYFHQEQVRRYPDYARYALRSELSGFSLFPTATKPGMTDDQLRYNLLRFGNEGHRFDAEIVRRGWYPKAENGRVWVADGVSVPARSHAAYLHRSFCVRPGGRLSLPFSHYCRNSVGWIDCGDHRRV